MGFLGAALLQRLVLLQADVSGATAYSLLGITRHAPAKGIAGVRYVPLGDFAGTEDWPVALTGVEVVVHTAARVHMMADTAADPLMEFRRLQKTSQVRFSEDH